jgi:hypothetical protein
MKTIGAARLVDASADLNSDGGRAFVKDSARFTEGVLTEAEFRQKWSLTNDDWAAMAANQALTDAVREERLSVSTVVRLLLKLHGRLSQGPTCARHAAGEHRHQPAASHRGRSRVASLSGLSRDDGTALDAERLVITINIDGRLPCSTGACGRSTRSRDRQRSHIQIPRLLQSDGGRMDFDDR